MDVNMQLQVFGLHNDLSWLSSTQGMTKLWFYQYLKHKKKINVKIKKSIGLKCYDKGVEELRKGKWFILCEWKKGTEYVQWWTEKGWDERLKKD